MPSPVSAIDLITQAMKVVGIISSGVGETPTADEATDGLYNLNDLIESMSVDNLMVYGAADEVFTLSPGNATRTIGPTGDYVTVRPVRISSAYTTYGGVDFPVQLIGQEEYGYIPLKTQTCQIIEKLAYVNDFPNGILSMWPTPSEAVPLTISIDRILSSVPNVATMISLPPNYLNYMKHALGIKLAPDYGVTPSQDVYEIARTSRAALKRANKVRRRAYFDEGITDSVSVWQTGAWW
jgi:hypothetical protein